MSPPPLKPSPCAPITKLGEGAAAGRRRGDERGTAGVGKVVGTSEE